jgi:hypothetical protein
VRDRKPLAGRSQHVGEGRGGQGRLARRREAAKVLEGRKVERPLRIDPGMKERVADDAVHRRRRARRDRARADPRHARKHRARLHEAGALLAEAMQVRRGVGAHQIRSQAVEHEDDHTLDAGRHSLPHFGSHLWALNPHLPGRGRRRAQH